MSTSGEHRNEQETATPPGPTRPEEPESAAPASDLSSAPEEAVKQSPAELASDSAGAGSEAAANPPAATGLRGRVRIGSRRDDVPDRPTGPKPQVKQPPVLRPPQGAAPVPSPPVSKRPVPAPSRRDPLPDDLQAELEAALAGTSLDELLAGESAAPAGQELEGDARRRATVLKVQGDDVFFSIDGRNEGVASVRQFPEPPEPGTQLDVIVAGYNADEGIYEVRVPGASIDVADWSDLVEGAVVEARVTGSNTGGLECKVNNIRGFIPASQIAQYRVENFNEFIDQKLVCVVTEANPQKRNLVLSRRAVLEREQEEQKSKLLEQLEVGQIREGVVRNLREFGAFVDLGGVDGLIHISQMSWERVNHPSEVLEEGQKVRVRVEKIDPQTHKIGLSLRSLQEHPWTGIEQRLPVGSVVKGEVTRIADFGAFVRVAPGVEGLVHISELAHHRVANVSSVVREGQEVSVKILSVEPEKQRMSLSLKATLQPPGPNEQEEEEAEAAPVEPAVPKHKGPLKGGVDRPSGGDQFGLNW